MLIASAFKRPVMWSSAGFVQVGRSNQLFLLLINITWPAIISPLSSLFFASPTRSLVCLYLFFGSFFFFHPLQYIPPRNSRSKNLQHFFITYGSAAKLPLIESKEFVKRADRGKRYTWRKTSSFIEMKIRCARLTSVETESSFGWLRNTSSLKSNFI